MFPVPKMYWAESDESVIGRPFFVMEKLDGVIIEFEIPDYLLTAPPDKIRRMSTRYAEVFAAIHRVDWRARGLEFLDHGGNPVERELAWWESELRRVQPGPLPAFEVIDRWLRDHMPEPSPVLTLVHGDPKPGNIFFQDEKIVGVFDWEMTTVGDPMTRRWIGRVFVARGIRGIGARSSGRDRSTPFRGYLNTAGLRNILPYSSLCARRRTFNTFPHLKKDFSLGESPSDPRRSGYGRQVHRPFALPAACTLRRAWTERRSAAPMVRRTRAGFPRLLWRHPVGGAKPLSPSPGELLPAHCAGVVSQRLAFDGRLPVDRRVVRAGCASGP